MEFTPFAGLTALDENDPITIDGASLGTRNPRIEDHLLQVGCVSHRHDKHAGVPDPHVAPTGQTIASGGQIAGSTTVALTYTVTDNFGGETKSAPPVVLTTGAQIGAPTITPSAQIVTSAGIMPAGNFYYAQTYTDGDGGETTLGPQLLVSVPPGNASASVVLSGLAAELGRPNGPVQWRLWRSYEGQDWHLVTQGSNNTYVDSGFNPPDDPARPPDANNTASTWQLAITLPTAAQDVAMAQGTSINLYLAADTSFTDPCFYMQIPMASAGHTILIPSETVAQGAPPRVSTSIPGAGQIFPDTDLVFGVKSPVDIPESLPSGAMGDMRVALSNLHVYAVLRQQGAANEHDWTDLTSISQGGVEVMGSGVGDAVWVTQSEENFEVAGSAASAQISDFANATASGTTMQVVNGLLTTSDPTQTDPVLGPVEGPQSLPLQFQSWPGRSGGPASVSGFAGWLGAPVGTLARSPAENIVHSWAEAGTPTPTPSSPPAPTYVNPIFGSNQLGDTLDVLVDSLVYTTMYYWDGTKWAGQYVDAASGLTYSATSNWAVPQLRRPAAHHPNVYAYQWTKPGQFADGYKLRARFHGWQRQLLEQEDGWNHPVAGLALNLGSDTQGLCYYIGIDGYAGWTTRPKDLVLDANNWPPRQYREPVGLHGADFDFGSPSRFAPTNVPSVFGLDDFWLEVWRIGNTAFAAIYQKDPALGGPPDHVSTFDTTGTAYAAGQSGYFGVVANHLGDTDIGIQEVTVSKATVLPTVTLFNQQELVFVGSGGINVGVQRLGSATAEIAISGGGIVVAGSGGTSLTSREGYVEFVGTGSAAVTVQDLGGGSARVTINSVSGPAGAAGAAGPALAVAGSAGVGKINPVPELDFAASGVGVGVSVQPLGGGSAQVLIGAAAVAPKATQASGYTFTTADVGTVVESASAGQGSGSIGFIIAPFSQSGIGLDSVIEVFQYGTGQVQIAPGAGVTLRSDGAKTKTAAQFATIGLRQRATDEWVLSGDLG